MARYRFADGMPARPVPPVPLTSKKATAENTSMSTTRKVAVFVGSLRKGSFNRMTAKVLMALAPAELHLEIVEIRDLPLYNQDHDDAPPAPYVAFREKVKAADAILFVTPEYNRSVPGVLKNALDVGSRPYGHSAWNGKPAAVISVSPGAVGGFGANHHLRQSLVFLNVPAMPQPEAYIGGAAALFDKEGNITNEGKQKFLKSFIEAFAVWVEKILSVR
jgi:chromate reductase, NAD(P)H dehydrogenase (quinone)